MRVCIYKRTVLERDLATEGEREREEGKRVTTRESGYRSAHTPLSSLSAMIHSICNETCTFPYSHFV